MTGRQILLDMFAKAFDGDNMPEDLLELIESLARDGFLKSLDRTFSPWEKRLWEDQLTDVLYLIHDWLTNGRPVGEDRERLDFALDPSACIYYYRRGRRPV